ncbi:MAG: hypothetical protein JW910_11270 [Anaerolineae bacterium]|nr:hypothetical protein [Anaerolineae bacterium]
MPLTFTWIEAGHILEYRLEAIDDDDDARQILSDEAALYASTPHAVHVLLNLTAVERIPSRPLTYARHSRLLTPQRGHLAVLCVTPAVRLFADVIAPLNRKRDFSFHGTRESALATLYEVLAREQAVEGDNGNA